MYSTRRVRPFFYWCYPVAVSTRHLLKAIDDRWRARSLDTLIPNGLFDTEAEPGTSPPYVVFEQSVGSVVTRMSGGTALGGGNEIRQVPFQLRVHARDKLQAATLAESIMDAMSYAPLAMLDGDFIDVVFQSDFPVQEGDNEWSWVLAYMARYDVVTVLEPA